MAEEEEHIVSIPTEEEVVDKEEEEYIDMEILKGNLFNDIMNRRWDEVIKTYESNGEVHTTKITKSGDTSLHIAVSNGGEDVVAKLVECIRSGPDPMKALEMQNERGNTALHLAASMGNVRMCQLIVAKNPALVGVRNNDGETPFFLAALHGRSEAFLLFHEICRGIDSYCRRNDGDTILHCAIAGEYFGLAYQIIKLYKKLVNYVNEQGLSPLHLLAKKPSAFRSGYHLGWFSRIVYHGTFFDKLTEARSHSQPVLSSVEEKNPDYPANYRTCIYVLQLMRRFIYIVMGRKDNKKYQESGMKPLIEHQGNQSSDVAVRNVLYPPNYEAFFALIKFLFVAVMVILGFGSRNIRKIQEKKKKHTWAMQVLNELLSEASLYKYDDNGRRPRHVKPDTDNETSPYGFGDGGSVTHQNQHSAGSSQISSQSDHKDLNMEKNVKDYSEGIPVRPISTSLKNKHRKYLVVFAGKEKVRNVTKKETPILIAAKNGVTEMVEKILEKFPVAIHDMNWEKKNIVLLAVENRQSHVYEFILRLKLLQDSVVRNVDNDGNSALHLAAMLGNHGPWLISGAALQMQWEIKWYKFVKNSMPPGFFPLYNKEGKTSKSIFKETHKELVGNGSKWLTDTSNSCSVVAALISAVAFATSATVPGGVNVNGKPNLQHQPAFGLFALSSLVALCFALTALVMFLAVLTSRYQEKDFAFALPRKLLLGLTSLFVSITSMLVSFCAGHFFVLRDELKYTVVPIYGATCLPVTLFAMAQFPLYFDLIRATYKKVPRRSYKVFPL